MGNYWSQIRQKLLDFHGVVLLGSTRFSLSQELFFPSRICSFITRVNNSFLRTFQPRLVDLTMGLCTSVNDHRQHNVSLLLKELYFEYRSYIDWEPNENRKWKMSMVKYWQYSEQLIFQRGAGFEDWQDFLTKKLNRDYP